MTDIFGKGHPDEPKAIYPGDCTKGEIGYCNAGRWAGWIFWRHPDGQWVSLAKIPDDKSADRPAAVSRADAIAARKSIENMTRSFTDMKPWQEICKRLLDDVIGDDPVMVDEVNPPAAVDVEALKLEIYRNHMRSIGWTNAEIIEHERLNGEDADYGYNTGCKMSVDAAIDYLAQHGHLTPAPTGERAEAFTLADFDFLKKLDTAIKYINTNPDADQERIAALETIFEAANRYAKQGHASVNSALSQPVHCTCNGKIPHPLKTGKLYPASTVLCDIAGQEGNDGYPYETMQQVADLIHRCGQLLSSPVHCTGDTVDELLARRICQQYTIEFIPQLIGIKCRIGHEERWSYISKTPSEALRNAIEKMENDNA